MAAHDHPDYSMEKTRLQETKDYIYKILHSTDDQKEMYKGNIKQAMIDLDHLDSSLSYINILTNAKFLEMSEKDFENLQRIQTRPYFARLDFTPDETKRTERLYIGKASLTRQEDLFPLIVDWRSPIANLYYEGRLGDVSYQAEQQEFKGNLSLKRQYVIRDGELEDIQDIDITAKDELLQKALASRSGKQLEDIVSTIQAEQNQVIRADMNQPLIVQGVAGSGKTTIALHRISYFIYTFAEDFDPDHFMILAPNRLFINYIAEALPELGVEDIHQNTYIDFYYECMGKKFKILPPEQKLLTLMEKDRHPDSEYILWSSRFKGSLIFKNIVKRYLQDVEKTFIPKQDIYLDTFKLVSYKKIRQLFQVEYAYLSYQKRLDKLRKVLQNHLKHNVKEILDKLEEDFDEQIESIRQTIRDPEMRRKKVIQRWEAKDKHLDMLRWKSKVVVRDYMKKLKNRTSYDIYQELICYPDLVLRYSSKKLNIEKLKWMAHRTQQSFKNKKIDIEDTAALLYIENELNGFGDKFHIRNVVIDEAQDFSSFQFEALKRVLHTTKFTILGDLSQGIHSYRGTSDWEQVIKGVFPEGHIRTLNRSYRTTVEIMNAANELLRPHVDPSILAQPVVRHGNIPQLIYYDQKKVLIQQITNKVEELKTFKYEQMAIIVKSHSDAQNMQRLLKRHSSLLTQLLKGEETFDTEADVIIVPAYIAKGLEFDVVMIVTLDDVFVNRDLDIKLLYVAMTRALHELSFFTCQGQMPLIESMPNELFLHSADQQEVSY